MSFPFISVLTNSISAFSDWTFVVYLFHSKNIPMEMKKKIKEDITQKYAC